MNGLKTSLQTWDKIFSTAPLSTIVTKPNPKSDNWSNSVQARSILVATFSLSRVFTPDNLDEVNISEGREVLLEISLCGVGSQSSDIKFPEALRSLVYPHQVTPGNDVECLLFSISLCFLCA